MGRGLARVPERSSVAGLRQLTHTAICLVVETNETENSSMTKIMGARKLNTRGRCA
jgi:hypothetical protein